MPVHYSKYRRISKIILNESLNRAGKSGFPGCEYVKQFILVLLLFILIFFILKTINLLFPTHVFV